jgi:hypothetical protein
MLYKIFAYPDNPTFEYQYKDGNWFRRKRGSTDEFTVLDKNGQKILNAYFKKKGFLFNISTTAKLTALVGILVGGTYLYLKFMPFKKAI